MQGPGTRLPNNLCERARKTDRRQRNRRKKYKLNWNEIQNQNQHKHTHTHTQTHSRNVGIKINKSNSKNNNNNNWLSIVPTERGVLFRLCTILPTEHNYKHRPQTTGLYVCFCKINENINTFHNNFSLKLCMFTF